MHIYQIYTAGHAFKDDRTRCSLTQLTIETDLSKFSSVLGISKENAHISSVFTYSGSTIITPLILEIEECTSKWAAWISHVVSGEPRWQFFVSLSLT